VQEIYRLSQEQKARSMPIPATLEQRNGRELMSYLDSSSECIGLLDMSQPQWPVLLGNDIWVQVTGEGLGLHLLLAAAGSGWGVGGRATAGVPATSVAVLLGNSIWGQVTGEGLVLHILLAAAGSGWGGGGWGQQQASQRFQ